MDTIADFPEIAMPAPDLDELRAELGSRGYTALATGQVLAYADQLGTLEGCIWVDPEDRAALDAILERAWPEVRQTSYAWDADRWHESPARWTLARADRIAALAEAFEAELAADEWDGPDSPEIPGREARKDREARRRWDAALMPPELDAIEGEPDPFEPTAEDLADLAAWSATLYPETPEDFPLTLDVEPFHP